MGMFRRKQKDSFKAMAEQSADETGDEPWFAGEDDGPELDVETGIGSNMSRRPEADD